AQTPGLVHSRRTPNRGRRQCNERAAGTVTPDEVRRSQSVALRTAAATTSLLIRNRLRRSAAARPRAPYVPCLFNAQGVRTYAVKTLSASTPTPKSRAPGTSAGHDTPR